VTKFEELFGIGNNKPVNVVYVLGLQTNNRLFKVKTHEQISNLTYASVQDRSVYKSYWAEKDLKEYLTKEDIESYINNKNAYLKSIIEIKTNKLSVDSIIQKLVEKGYIKNADTAGNYALTAKLVLRSYIPKKEFETFLPEKPQKPIHNKPDKKTANMTQQDIKLFCAGMQVMLQQYCTYFESFGTKMDIIRFVKFASSKLIDLTKQFKICEILVEKNEDDLAKEKLPTDAFRSKMTKLHLHSSFQIDDDYFNQIANFLIEAGYLAKDYEDQTFLTLQLFPCKNIFRLMLMKLCNDSKNFSPKESDADFFSKSVEALLHPYLTRLNYRPEQRKKRVQKAKLIYDEVTKPENRKHA